jgi:hypothetical protein
VQVVDLGWFTVQKLKTLVETAAVVAGGVASLYQWRLFRFRDRLKADLEILKNYKALGRHAKADQLGSHIDATVDRVYPAGVGAWRQTFPWLDIIVGASCMAVAAAWLWYFEAVEEWWHAVAAGVLIFLGSGALFNAYERWHHVHALRRAPRGNRRDA